MKVDRTYWFISILVLFYGASASPVTTENFKSAAAATVGPCENFHEYACSNHSNNTDFKSLMSQARNNVVNNLKHLMEAEINQEDIQPLKMMKIFYDSCSNIENINSQGLDPIKSILHSFGGWPIFIDSRNDNNVIDWQSILSFYGKINVFPLYHISTHDDVYLKKNKIEIRQPTTMLIKHEETNIASNACDRYVNFIVRIAEIFYDISESSSTEEELKLRANQIVSFETELSEILSPKHDLSLYRPTVLKQFQEIIDENTKNNNVVLNWTSIINSMYSGSTELVNEDTVIDVTTPQYYPKLIRLLEETPLHTIVNYIHWKFILEFLPYTSDEVRNLYFGIEDVLQNPAVEKSRHTACTSEPFFEPIITYQYAKHYITPDIETSANQILNDVKQATLATIKESTLLTENEKVAAERKVLNMKFILGISEDSKNEVKLLEFYNSNSLLTIGNNYFENILAIRRFSKIKELERVQANTFVNRENDYFMKISNFLDATFTYSFFTNEAYIRIEHLTQPLFDPNYSNAKKYGILGFTFARSIMRGFDEADSVDIYATPHIARLYSDETRNKFWDKMNCFVTQTTDLETYWSRPSIPGTLSPVTYNIGDTAALEIAHRIYRSKAQGAPSTADNKEFFKLFVDVLCRPELPNFNAKFVDNFTMSEFRVMGSLPNVKAFAEVYDCPKGSQMNPDNKCSLHHSNLKIITLI